MTPEEREAVIAELREETAWLERYVAEHGEPWGGWRPEWARPDDYAGLDQLDDDAA